MEETKWLTKGKIIVFIIIVLIFGGILTFFLVHRSNLKKEYIKFENQLEYAAPNYILKEKIELKSNEWREINIKDILKQKLVINKKASDCKGYVIVEAQKKNIDSENTNNEYNAYITCKNIYKTKGYGTKPTKGIKNQTQTQTQKDTEKPKIELFGDAKVFIKVGEEYEELGAVANDNIDGDITSKIKIDGTVDTTKEGNYTIKYTVSDSSNNKSSIERIVVVEKEEEPEVSQPVTPEQPKPQIPNNTPVYTKDTTSPIITFNDNSLYQTICEGNKVDISVNGPYGFVARDNVDGIITSKVSITGDIGIINTPGTYNVYYSVSDNAGNKATASKQFNVKSCSSTIPNTSSTISVSSLKLTPNNATMQISNKLQLVLTINPSNATNKDVVYTSSNPSVASVSDNGIVTALSKGTTRIIVTSKNGKSAICNITVE